MGPNLAALVGEMLGEDEAKALGARPSPGRWCGSPWPFVQRVRQLLADQDPGDWDGEMYVPSGSALLYLRLWPAPFCIRRDQPGGPWHPAELDLDLAIMRMADAGGIPARPEPWVARAIERVPGPIRGAIAPFRTGQWRLLVLAWASTAMADLIRSNPALAWALAHWERFQGATGEAGADPALPLLSARQRDIAAWLGFPRTESAVRLLRKIPPQDCAREPILALRRLIARGPVAEVLRHLPELPAALLLAAAAPKLGSRLGPRCLAQIAEAISQERASAAVPAEGAEGAEDHHLEGTGCGRLANPADESDSITTVLEDTVRLAHAAGKKWLPDLIPSLGALRRLHDALVSEADFRSMVTRNYDFPPPPVPPVEGIEPLATPRMLWQEGRDQHHCLVVHSREVAGGDYYGYRVTRCGRATVGIRRKRDGSWRIAEVRAAHNARPPLALRNFVKMWLEQNGPVPALPGTPRGDSDLQLLMPFADIVPGNPNKRSQRKEPNP